MADIIDMRTRKKIALSLVVVKNPREIVIEMIRNISRGITKKKHLRKAVEAELPNMLRKEFGWLDFRDLSYEAEGISLIVSLRIFANGVWNCVTIDVIAEGIL